MPANSLIGSCSLRLTCELLGHRFGRRRLFRNLSFAVSQGQSLAITGANGSGKSTLLRIIAGVLSPVAGTVSLSVGGEKISMEDRPLRTGLVAPYLNVYDGFTARENLQFLARARQMPAAAGRIEEVLDLVGLTPRADEYVAIYSSGMKQRVKFAAAVLASPPVLLLDEPSSNLDAAGLDMVARITEHQMRAGGLVIAATNDPSEAEKCQSTVRIEDFG